MINELSHNSSPIQNAALLISSHYVFGMIVRRAAVKSDTIVSKEENDEDGPDNTVFL